MTNEVECTLFIGEGEQGAEAPFIVTDEDIKLSRAPVAGEVITCGNDERGCAREYEVVLVVHRPDAESVEVYAKRINLFEKITAPTPPWRRPFTQS